MSTSFESFENPTVSSPRARAKFGLARIIACGALVMGLAGGAGAVTLAATNATADEPAAAVSSYDSITLAEEVAAKCLPSVGSVYVLVEEGGMQGISQGSCEIINSEGYLVTNYHVISGAVRIQVSLGSNMFEAELVGSDPTSDIAVLKIDAGDFELTPIDIGTSSDLRVGQWVMTLGSPKGEVESVSAGIISGLDRTSYLSIDKTTKGYYVGLIQTDAMINSGSSGGALVDANGALIGVTTLNATLDGDFAGMSYAIPVDYAMHIVNQIMEYGFAVHPVLGVSASSITDAYYQGVSSAFDDSQLYGAYISALVPGGPAEKAGIRQGDIVTKVDDRQIYSPDDLIIAIRDHEIGESVKVELLRRGVTLTVDVTFGSDRELVVEEEAEQQTDPGEFSNVFGGFGGSTEGTGYGSGGSQETGPGRPGGGDFTDYWGSGSQEGDPVQDFWSFIRGLGEAFGW